MASRFGPEKEDFRARAQQSPGRLRVQLSLCHLASGERMPLRRLWDVDGNNLLTLGAWDPEMSPAVEDGGLCGTGSSGTAAFGGAGPGACGVWRCRFQCVLFGATARWGEIGVI